MKLFVEIEGLPEPLLAEIDARDRRAFEREGAKDIGLPPLAALKDITASRPESFTGWLAWHALRRVGKTETKSWAEFEPLLVGTIVEEAEEEDDITNPTVPVNSEG